MDCAAAVYATAAAVLLDGVNQAELRERRNAVVKSDLLSNLAVLNPQYCGSGDMHLVTRGSGQQTNEKVAERGTCVRAPTLPTSDDMIALRYEAGSAPEIEVRKGLSKMGHERLDVSMPTAGRVQ